MIHVKSQVAEKILLVSLKSDLIAEAELALSKINSKPNGRSLLEKINNLSTEEKFVRIDVTNKNSSKAMPCLTKSQLQRFNIKEYDFATNNKIAMDISHFRGHEKGEGVSAEILWSINDALEIKGDGFPKLVKNKDQSFISLAHELVHASRYLEGIHYHDGKFPMPTTGSYLEEERAIGMGHFANETMSENGVRIEHGLKIRQSYFEAD